MLNSSLWQGCQFGCYVNYSASMHRGKLSKRCQKVVILARHKRITHALRMHAQGQIKRAQPTSGDLLQYAKADNPAAAFILVRPERASVRFGLRQRAAVTAILHGLEELGWPTDLTEMEICMYLPGHVLHGCCSQQQTCLTVVSVACPLSYFAQGGIIERVGTRVKGAVSLSIWLQAYKTVGRHPHTLYCWHLKFSVQIINAPAQIELLLIRHLSGTYCEQPSS